MLLLGSDDDSKFAPERFNTQSMILMRVDPSTKQATLLSIPRDLWVPMPNQGWGKISTAYQMGGAPAAVTAVESNFKVHIDDYVWIGLNGLVNLINKLGGVNLQDFSHTKELIAWGYRSARRALGAGTARNVMPDIARLAATLACRRSSYRPASAWSFRPPHVSELRSSQK